MGSVLLNYLKYVEKYHSENFFVMKAVNFLKEVLPNDESPFCFEHKNLFRIRNRDDFNLIIEHLDEFEEIVSRLNIRSEYSGNASIIDFTINSANKITNILVSKLVNKQFI